MRAAPRRCVQLRSRIQSAALQHSAPAAARCSQGRARSHPRWSEGRTGPSKCPPQPGSDIALQEGRAWPSDKFCRKGRVATTSIGLGSIRAAPDRRRSSPGSGA